MWTSTLDGLPKGEKGARSSEQAPIHPTIVIVADKMLAQGGRINPAMHKTILYSYFWYLSPLAMLCELGLIKQPQNGFRNFPQFENNNSANAHVDCSPVVYETDFSYSYN